MTRLNAAALTWIVLCPLFLFNCSSSNKTKSKVDKRADLYYTHGTAALLRKDYTDALDKLLKANEARPEDSKILNNLGMAYFFKRRNTEGESFLKKAIDLDPKNSDAKVNLASLYFHIGKFEQSKRLYLKVLGDLVYRHQYRTHYNLALIYLKEGKKEAAVKSLHEALAAREEYCVAFFTLGQIANKDYRYFDALNWFKKGSNGTCHEKPAPLYEQAITYLNLKKYEKASMKFSEVVERFPKSKYAMMASMRMKSLKRSNFLTRQMLDNIEIRKMKLQLEKSGQKKTKKAALLNSPTF
jgi:tetratricopeptide (TPR) repeat protein